MNLPRLDEKDPRGWAIRSDGIKVHFTITAAGEKLVKEGGTP